MAIGDDKVIKEIPKAAEPAAPETTLVADPISCTAWETSGAVQV